MNSPHYHAQYFTATILGWKHLLKPNKYKDIIIDSLRFLVGDKRIELNAFSIMSNHMHLIWQIQFGHKREDVQRDFLKYTSQMIKKDLETNHPLVLELFEVNLKDRKYQFWQRNPLSIDLWTKGIYLQKMQYIHENPVKAGICRFPEEYKYSSAKFSEKGEDEFGILTHWME
jgi:REP element-mobilizing transposase RayT